MVCFFLFNSGILAAWFYNSLLNIFSCGTPKCSSESPVSFRTVLYAFVHQCTAPMRLHSASSCYIFLSALFFKHRRKFSCIQNWLYIVQPVSLTWHLPEQNKPTPRISDQDKKNSPILVTSGGAFLRPKKDKGGGCWKNTCTSEEAKISLIFK